MYKRNTSEDFWTSDRTENTHKHSRGALIGFGSRNKQDTLKVINTY